MIIIYFFIETDGNVCHNMFRSVFVVLNWVESGIENLVRNLVGGGGGDTSRCNYTISTVAVTVG